MPAGRLFGGGTLFGRTRLVSSKYWYTLWIQGGHVGNRGRAGGKAACCLGAIGQAQRAAETRGVLLTHSRARWATGSQRADHVRSKGAELVAEGMQISCRATGSLQPLVPNCDEPPSMLSQGDRLTGNRAARVDAGGGDRLTGPTLPATDSDKARA